MIRAERLAVSRPMYAFAPETFSVRDRTVQAVWFRRKKGVLVASTGSYHFFAPGLAEGAYPASYLGWVELHTDNRYGATHLASWDGVALLNSDQPVTPEEASRRVAFLAGMVAGFPQVPTGFDGWWAFPR
jgi:hypothetical protein